MGAIKGSYERRKLLEIPSEILHPQEWLFGA
jgi:hypothetical protein